MFPLTNLHSGESVHNVPDENIEKVSEGVYIWQKNLKYLDDEIVDTNLKKFDYPKLVPENRYAAQLNCESPS